MVLEVEMLAPHIDARTATWDRLGIRWRHHHEDPNHGKPLVTSMFECSDWLGEVTVWATGECEFACARTTDDWIVGKHYDLASETDLALMLDEVAALLADGVTPPRAVRSRWPPKS